MINKHKIGLGTVQFGMRYGITNQNGQTKEDEVALILKLANEQGIDLLDTAANYGDSEMVLGRLGIEAFQVVTKFNDVDSPEKLNLVLGQSLNKLCIRKLHGFLAHNSSIILRNPTLWTQLQNLRENGNIERIGYSIYSPQELEQLLESGFIPSIIQIPFNYLDHRFEPYLAELKYRGCEIHSRSTFLQGLLLTEPNSLPPFFESAKAVLSMLWKQVPSNLLPSTLLKHVVSNPLIDRAIIGVENTKQLSQILEGLEEAKELPAFNTSIRSEILMPNLWPKFH